MAGSSEPVFQGVGASLVTLFQGNGRVAAEATAALAGTLIEAGVRAVAVADWPGEGPALTAEERAQLLDAVRDVIPASSDVALVAGTGAPSAGQAARLTKEACDHGADAVLVCSPVLAGDPRRYYDDVLAAADGVPVVAQHVPGVAPPGIQLPDLLDLQADAYADATPDAERLLETLEAYRRPVYIGSSAILSFAGPVGATGAFVALANVEPELCIKAFAGDGKAQDALTKTHVAAQVDFPRRLKELVARRFGTPTGARMG